jgi:hypothetical protein
MRVPLQAVACRIRVDDPHALLDAIHRRIAERFG